MQNDPQRPWKQSKLVRGLFGLLALALAIYVGVLTRNALEQYNYIGTVPHERDTITVEGDGKVSATPDIAMLQLGVQSDGATVAAAQADNTSKMNAITAAMKTLGVQDADLTTSNYSIQPKIDYNNGKQNITGYTVMQNLTVKLRDLSKVGDAISQAGQLGANVVSGPDFTIDDPTSVQAQAREKAIADAKTKAMALAQQLGVSLVKVTGFSEGSNTPPPIFPYAMNAAAGSVEAAPVPQVQAGSLDVQDTVNITYEVN